MHRKRVLVTAVACFALIPAGVARAVPQVTFRGRAVPIPGFPHTGNFFGAGAAAQGEVTIKGTEYGGYPPPLIGAKLWLPEGTRLHPSGFPTCPTATLVEAKEPNRCPRGSKAGPVGHARGFVVFGGERVEEEVTIESFFAPGGGINFFVAGHTPTIIEITSTARIVSLHDSGGYGPEFAGTVPLVETVPGAPDGSTSWIKLQVGAAIKKGKETIYYGRVPTKCPKGGFRVKAELIFANTEDLPMAVPGAVVPVTTRAPCPTHR